MAEDKTPDFLFFVVSETLSDGSKVYNVHFGDEVFHAVDEDKACALAEAMSEAVNENSVDTAGVVYE